MVDFPAHFTIHAIKIGFQNTTFYLDSVVLESRHLPLACQSERRYFHLNRINDSFAIDRLSSHTLLAAKGKFRVV